MIGIITFHGSHNCGSMLQAYATQKFLERLGHKSEIINFRMQSQKDYYALYQTKYGLMRFCRGLLLFPIHGLRSRRAKKFEEFMNGELKLSGRELSTYDDLESVKSKYEVYLAGSDQIWSNRVPELAKSPVDYTGVYFLDFVDENKKRVSYASSIGEATFNELISKKQLLLKFSAISTREKAGANIIEKLLGVQPVETVIDPTLALNSSEWRRLSGKEPIVKGKYVLLYTLQGIRNGLQWARALKEFSARYGLIIVCVSPFFPVLSLGVKNLVDVGPKEFVNLIDNAEVVFTDSFHGTAFSINMNTPFYSLTKERSKDNRKAELLERLGLGSRKLLSYQDVALITQYDLDFSLANQTLEELRAASGAYLQKVLT